MKIFQGSLEFSHCLYRKELCPDIKTCPLRKKILSLEKRLVKELESITIQSLLDDKP